MKVISYSIFGADNTELHWYLRGILYNVTMNKLLFPEWQTIVYVEMKVMHKYFQFISNLKAEVVVCETENLCKSMLWRLKPIFNEAEYVLCRDADSLTTYREAQMVNEFINSDLSVHGITDNPAHTQPLMGGLCGFKASVLRDKYKTWDNLISKSKINIGERGTDQVFMAQEIYPHFKDQMFGHYIKGCNPNGEARVRYEVPNGGLPGVDPKLWESNLCVDFAGSAGCKEMETVRFLNRFSPGWVDYNLAIMYPKIYYWI